MVESAFAQSILTPSVPEFTLKFIQAYYNDTNPPEGATEIIIKNQPFAPPNNLTQLFYGLRLKGHDDKNWTEVYSINLSNLYPANSSSENTIIVFPQWGFFVYGEVDFQVEAVIATAHPNMITPFGSWTYDGISNWSDTKTVNVPIFSFYPTPTPSSSASTPTSTANNSYPSISFLLITNTISLIVIAILVAIIIALLLLRHRKTISQNKLNVYRRKA